MRWIVPAGVVAVSMMTGCREVPTVHHGVRLGDTMAEVRAAFDGGPGAWSSETGKVPSLTWRATGETSRVSEARFEFHGGMMVAARFVEAEGAREAKGPPVDVTPASVIERRREGGVVRVNVVSRSCPEHVDEVAKILSSAKP